MIFLIGLKRKQWRVLSQPPYKATMINLGGTTQKWMMPRRTIGSTTSVYDFNLCASIINLSNQVHNVELCLFFREGFRGVMSWMQQCGRTSISTALLEFVACSILSRRKWTNGQIGYTRKSIRRCLKFWRRMISTSVDQNRTRRTEEAVPWITLLRRPIFKGLFLQCSMRGSWLVL